MPSIYDDKKQFSFLFGRRAHFVFLSDGGVRSDPVQLRLRPNRLSIGRIDFYGRCFHSFDDAPNRRRLLPRVIAGDAQKKKE